MIGITGATGILGKILCEKLKNEKMETSSFKGDICKKEDLIKWISKNKFEAIIHLAAIVPTIEVKSDPLRAYEVNVSGTINLLSALKQNDQSPWVFYASSSHVYKSKDSPIKETDTVDPVSLYGMTKYIGEKICVDSAPKNNFSICCGRIFSFFHNSQKAPFLYPNILKRLQTEDITKSFFLYGADSERDFLNAEEVVDIIIGLMNKKVKGIYNIASGRSTKIRDFVQNLTDKKLKIETNNEIPNKLVADISKLELT